MGAVHHLSKAVAMRVKEVNNSRKVCAPERVLEILQCIEMEPFSMSWSALRYSGMLVPGCEGTFAPGHGGMFISDNVVHLPQGMAGCLPQGMVGCLPLGILGCLPQGTRYLYSRAWWDVCPIDH